MAVSANGKRKSLIRLPPRHCNQTEALYSVRNARFRFREFPTSRLDLSGPHDEVPAGVFTKRMPSSFSRLSRACATPHTQRPSAIIVMVLNVSCLQALVYLAKPFINNKISWHNFAACPDVYNQTTISLILVLFFTLSQ